MPIFRHIQVRTVFLLGALLIIFPSANAQAPEILEVHFAYGYKGDYGGIHGGHVSVTFRGIEYGFFNQRAIYRYFPKKDKSKYLGAWRHSRINVYRRKNGDRYLIIKIPITPDQAAQFEQFVADEFRAEDKEGNMSTRYDYAVFGYRCASATYDILGEMGLEATPPRSRTREMYQFFYPKRLRSYLVKKAVKENWEMIRIDESNEKKFEGDRRKVRKLIHRHARPLK